MKRRVVVTGMGALTPIGNTAAESWSAAKEGKCGIGPITQYDTSDMIIKIAGEVKNLKMEEHLSPKESRKMDRYTQLAVIAAKEAFLDSGLDMEKEDSSRCGVVVSSGIGGINTIQTECLKGNQRGFDRISPYFVPMSITNMAAGEIAIRHGFKGYAASVVTACAGGTNAIGDAFRQIRDGYAEVMMAGGAESCIGELPVGGFTSLKALSDSSDPQRASVPFDKERSGFVMGEGAGILVLEEYEHAKARGAKIYGEIVGYGANCDAYHITAPNPEGEGGAACMAQALKDAGIKPTDVAYVNAHGTSTPLNDACETMAIHKTFGEHAQKLAVSSTKSMTGHLLGATGAVEAIFSILAIKDSFVPPTIHYQVPDEACDLDVVPNVGREMDIPYAISNSLGFGGHNATLVFKKFEEA